MCKYYGKFIHGIRKYNGLYFSGKFLFENGFMIEEAFEENHTENSVDIDTVKAVKNHDCVIDVEEVRLKLFIEAVLKNSK